MPASRRDTRTTRLLDPVWHALRGGLDVIYQELEPGMCPVTMSLLVIDLEGQPVVYSFDGKKLERGFVPKDNAELEKAIEVVNSTVIDTTPPGDVSNV